ncbi:hypothetical protein, partial [Glaesserella parasuis]|uniref:hypothetical protein n=1 Tax=Glaesserella parasuis TaxID=738 RepID=UPI003F39A70A
SLLKSGAIPLTCGEDILRDLGWGDLVSEMASPSSGVPVPEVLRLPTAGAGVDTSRTMLPVTGQIPLPLSLSDDERRLWEAVGNAPQPIADLQQT